jgi:hypothetical protein
MFRNGFVRKDNTSVHTNLILHSDVFPQDTRVLYPDPGTNR